MNPKLLQRMERKPRVTGKYMVYAPVNSLASTKNIPMGARVRTTSLCDASESIEVEFDDTIYRVFLKDLCKA